MAKRRKEEEQTNSMSWLVTFSDLITLLFTFFVLLLSMCSLEAGKIEQLQTTTLEAMGVLLEGKRSEVDYRIITSKKRHVKIEQEIEWRLSAQYNALITWLSETLQNEVECEETEKGLTIVVKDQLLFAPSTAGISAKGAVFLGKMGNFIKDIDVDIVAEGHTDSIPIETKRFSSNWDLSIARAISVVTFLSEKTGIDPVRLCAVGYGETKPRVPNDTPENRSKNRRVELILAPNVL
jgi:chemotaxis protein MotB